MSIARLTFSVTGDDTASALGSGDLDVLATPRLLAWCEAATCRAAEDLLDQARTSVGTRVQLDHLHATAVGAQVEVTADLVHSDGRLMEFDVTAFDRVGPDGEPRLIATGRVRRVAVDRQRFLARLVRAAPPARGPGP